MVERVSSSTPNFDSFNNSEFFPTGKFKKLSRKYSVNIYYVCMSSTIILGADIYLIVVQYVKNIQVDLVHIRHDTDIS